MSDLGDLPDLRSLERRIDRLETLAQTRVEEFLAARQRLEDVAAFLRLVPAAQATLEELTSALFGEVLAEVETNLTYAIQEILGQQREIRSSREIRNSRLFIEFSIFQGDAEEDILTGQGGSVCNILSVGLRLIALSQLDEHQHRPFLVLDEQDCWLRPQLVPRFMEIIAAISQRLDVQVLVISHHPVDLFSEFARTVYSLRPDGETGVRLSLLENRSTCSSGQ